MDKDQPDAIADEQRQRVFDRWEDEDEWTVSEPTAEDERSRGRPKQER